MVGRGGKKPNNRSGIASGRLQNMIRFTRIIGSNTDDGGTSYGKDLERQRAASREEEREQPILIRTNIHRTTNPQQVQEEQGQEEPYIDCQSEGLVHGERTEDILDKRKRMTKLGSRVAM